MDIGVIIALCVATTLTLISGIAAGLFGGMWWQARQTAQVWEKAYTHVREQLQIKFDTYNVTQPKDQRDPRAFDGVSRERVRVQAATNAQTPPDVRPSQEAERVARSLNHDFPTKDDELEMDDDPFAPQIRR